MNDLALHIEYLLLRHDCVIVPGLGAFLAHRNEAYIDGETGLLMPPSRSLGFNAELTHSDGLLIGSVARRASVSFEAARAEVDRAVAAFTHQLREAGSMPVGELGMLSLSSDTDSLVFEPSADSTIVNMPLLGLAPVSLAALGDEAEPHVEIAAPRRRLRWGRAVKIAASIAIVLISVGVLFTRGSLPAADRHEYASIDSGIRTNVEKMMEAGVDEGISLSREIVLNIARPVETAPVAEPVRKAPGRYLLVVGSFPTGRAAERFIDGRAGLSVIEMDGNYRVYASSADTMNEARDAASSLASEYPSLWICRR